MSQVTNGSENNYTVATLTDFVGEQEPVNVDLNRFDRYDGELLVAVSPVHGDCDEWYFVDCDALTGADSDDYPGEAERLVAAVVAAGKAI